MKKVVKLVLPLLLTFIFILSFTAVSANAASTTAVATTEFNTHQGELFSTTLYIPDNANIVDFDITVKYDTDKVKLISAEENEDAKGSIMFNTETSGEISINYTRTSKNVTSYLPLIDFEFQVDDNIGIGNYDLLTVDKSSTYLAHRLNSSGALEKVDFDCDFSKLIIYEMGDVDLSCSVDIADATYIRRHLAQFDGAILTGFKLSLADTYTDGVVDIADASCIQRRLAKMDVNYGNRINIVFFDADGNKCITKSVYFGGSLTTVPTVPEKKGYTGGKWSLSATEYVEPDLSNLTEDLNLYVYYDKAEQTTDALEYYKQQLTDMYYSGDLPTNLCSNLNLRTELYYQKGYHAMLVWNSDCNYVLNSTTGDFTKPTYPQDLSLGVKIISYDDNNVIEGEDRISFDYAVPGMFKCPTKEDVEGFLKHYLTDDTDGQYRINYDVKLLSKVNNTVIPTEGSLYDNFEIRLNWYQNIDGTLTPVNQVKRTTSSQVNDYVAVATFNGKPLEDDGKIFFDDVNVTAIEQLEIKNYIINQIAANQGTLATDGTELWNNDTVYGTTVRWETGNPKLAYVANNIIQLKQDAVSGSTLPLNAHVSYLVNDEVEEFVLSYNLTISCDNTRIKYPENMDESLYNAIKAELEDKLGYRGDLTSAALADVRFVNLDLSGYPDILSLRGLSYCSNLRTLNISGLHIIDGTMNQIATLSYLEAFIARGCGLDNLTDGGTATLCNATGLKLLDLTDNNFTSLDSVFAEGKKYGKLREVYLSNNKLKDINALQRAPMMTYLSLSGNGLTTEGAAAVENYPILTYLSLANNKIDSVEHLKNLRYLKELRLQNNNLTNINDLRRLVNLEILYLGHNQIKDIGFLNSLTQLSVLYANDNDISSVSALTDLAKLEVINVSNNNIPSLAVLIPYKSTLTEIYAENNKITDFSFINGASKLHILMLAGNKMNLAQDNMSSWLSGLSNMEVLTLSDIKLNDLSFLSSMKKLVRLDVDNCGLYAFSGEISNIAKIAEIYSTLKVLVISNNNFDGYDNEIMKLRNATLLTVFFADNICDNLDIETLTYSMTELKYISLENCGITSMEWLSKFNELIYVDLSGNSITDVNLNQFISNASIKTIKELYLDTDVACAFENAYRITDFNVEKLSLEGANIGRVEKLPYLDSIKYLNLSKSGLTNLTGDDEETFDLYSIERFSTLETLDISENETDISPVENLSSINTLYAVGATDSKLFYEDNLHSLQRLYNSGVTCYLYDKNTEYVPTAAKEGKDILNLIDDISCDITVAADNVISDNNPFIIDEINDFDITWSVSNSENYEIKNNHLSVKSYDGIEDEKLTVTATITVYPDQDTVSRDFTINTSILRVSPKYYSIDATGYSEQLTRDSSFTYDFTLKTAETEGFSIPVKPVEDNIEYSYSAVTSTGVIMPYVNVISVGENHHFTVTSAAPLNSLLTIKININHFNKNNEKINDMEQLEIPVTIAERTFTVTFVMNGGNIVDSNNLNRETITLVEDSDIFSGLTYSNPGYRFDGWFTDAEFNNLFSETGENAVMPSYDITLYAKWTALSYNVYFNANGGSVKTASITALSNVEIGALPIPVRSYYTFDGWYTAATGGNKVTSTSTFARTEDLTLYAHWILNTYTVSWSAGTGTSITVKRTSSPNAGAATGNLSSGAKVYYGDVLSVTYSANTGYTLATKGSTSITINSNITSNTIYATATVNSYTASWSAGTGATITVNRTASPKKGAATGTLSSGATVYYGDVLTVTYSAKTGYSLSTKGLTSITVSGNVTSSTIYATATPNSYTYNIVYKSSNGTNLGSSTATYKYGTTNTITPPAKSGYNTPASQSVKWDSTSAKTITFTYSPSSVSTSQYLSNGAWWDYDGTGRYGVYYSANAEYKERTANSIKIRIVWTQTINSAYYGYNQYFVASFGGWNNAHTGNVLIASTSTWPASTYRNDSRTVYSEWVTVPVSATATSIWIASDWWAEYADQKGSFGHSFNIPTY